MKLQSKYKIPQVGWNKVFFKDTSKIYKPHKTAWFYFVHSYHCVPEDKKNHFCFLQLRSKNSQYYSKRKSLGNSISSRKIPARWIEFFNSICQSLMHPIRIIPCLDIKDAKVVKGKNFVDLKNVGEPLQLQKTTTNNRPMS